MGSRRPVLLWLSALLLLFSLGSLPVPADVLLVVPFDNTARAAELDWVGESFAETLIEQMGRSGHLLLNREERLGGLERLGLPAAPALTHASWLRLAEELKAERVVLGGFRVEDEQLIGWAQLLDVRRLTLSPPVEERGSFTQLRDVQSRLAWKILRQLDPALPFSQQAFLQGSAPLPATAFESYVRGLLALTRERQMRYFLQAARSQPGYSPPAFRLAQLYFDDQDYSTAARWFSKIPADDSLALDARFYLSLCQFFARDFVGAAATLASVAERLPVKQVWNNLGIYASRQGLGQEAYEHFARALKDDSGDPDLYFNLGLHHLRRGEWDKALQALDRCAELNPGDTEAHFLRAHALAELGRTQEAERARQQAVGDNPALALSLERRQLELDRLQEQFSARVALFERQRQENRPAGSARTQHVAVHVERGEDLLARGRLEAARDEFTEAILLDPESHRAHFFLAEIYRRQGRLPAAISELKAALWSQESVTARLRLAELYLAENRPAEAREQVRAALALDPGNPSARALEAQLAAGSAGAEGKPQ